MPPSIAHVPSTGLLVLSFWTFIPNPGLAQETVRVVEVVSETTGDRQRYVVQDLSEPEIKAVQTALREEGYIGIGWTGRLDDGTVEGLGRFQRERGLVECGCISYETVVALGLRPDVVASVAVGPGAPAAVGGESPYGSSVSSGIYYPVGIPIYIPRPPPCESDPCDGEDGDGSDGEGPGYGGSHVTVGSPAAAGDGASGMTATPPGIRPPPLSPRGPN